MLNIPGPGSNPYCAQTTAIDGVSYVLTWTYSQRAKVLYLSIADTNGVELASGIKIVCGIDLLHNRRRPGLPVNTLMAVPNGLDSSPPDLGELGPRLRVELRYFSFAELVEAVRG